MIPEISRLDLRVHLVNGSVLDLEQADPEKARHTLIRLVPARVFAQPLATIAGDYHSTTLRTSHITSVEIFFEGEVDWSYGPNLTDVVVIDQERFNERVWDGGDDESLKREQPRKEGDLFVGYDCLQMAGGRSIYLEVHGVTRNRAVQARATTRFFESPSILARVPGRGFEAINPANIVSASFHPGSPEVTVDTWFAHLRRETL